MRKSKLALDLLTLAFLAGLAAAPSLARGTSARTDSPQTVHVVTSTADSGPGTLREALMEALAGDTIQFDPAVFPPASPASIILTGQLPPIAQDNLTIDASNTGVILDGSTAGGGLTPGLYIQAHGVTVRGLQIVSFAGCGIEIHGHDNVIGGDRSAGTGPLGQGNLLSGSNNHSGVGLFNTGAYSNTIQGNLIGVSADGLAAWGNAGEGIHINGGHHNLIKGNVIGGNGGAGVQICCTAESAYNAIQDNLIGVGVDGQTPVPNFVRGVIISDGAHHNTIGPGNVIANTTSGGGISIGGALSPGNTISGNSVYNNADSGISVGNKNVGLVPVPAIAAFDLLSGTVSGATCPHCIVQIYSDEDNEGRVYEGQASADAKGEFSFAKGAPLTGPHLTTTATDASGTTSMFSVPTTGAGSTALQMGNAHAFHLVATRRADQLTENRLGSFVQDQSWVDCGMTDADVLNWLGAKRAHGAMNDPDASLIDWDTDELFIHQNFDQMITELEQHGIEFTYVLIFWDKEHHRQTGQTSLPRFQTEEEIERYLDFVRLMVQTFGDRVDSWELWNEPGHDPECNQPLPGAIMCIPVETYIDVAERAIALIRQEDPGSSIVVPSYHAWDPHELYQNYLYPILESDLMPLVDVISWHPFLVNIDSQACGGDFFDHYWGTVLPEIKSLASAHGFQGEFRADDLGFAVRTPSSSNPCAVFDRTAAKYLLREAVHHLGEDVATGTIMNADSAGQAFARLSTLMAGAQVQDLSVEISASVTDTMSYTFSLPGGDYLVALWQDVDMQDEDPAAPTSLRIVGFGDRAARGLDLLAGFQQELDIAADGPDLVIDGLMIKDYPLFLRLSPVRAAYLPLVIR